MNTTCYEAEIVRCTFGCNVSRSEALIKWISHAFEVDLVCITRGIRGAYLGSSLGVTFCKAYPVTVNDTVGAGNAFSTGLLYALNQGDSWEEALDFSCRIGALVASKTGAVPDYHVDEIRKLDRPSNSAG